MTLLKLTRTEFNGETRAVFVNPDFIASLEWTDGRTRVELAGGTVLRVSETPFQIAQALSDTCPACGASVAEGVEHGDNGLVPA